MRRVPLLSLVLGLSVVAVTAAADDTPVGLWHARLVPTPEHDVAFDLKISRSPGGFSAWILNGKSELPFTSVAWDGRQLTLALAHMDAALTATRSAEGLVGTYARTTAVGRIEVPFEASKSPAPPPKVARNSPDLTGSWGVEIEEGKGITKTVGLFRQSGSALTGTMREATGDYGALHGTYDGSTFVLSVFDGNHIYRFDGAVQPDGSLRGEFRSRVNPPLSWRAKRLSEKEAEAWLPDAFSTVRAKDPSAAYRFAYPDEDGRAVSSDDPRFSGKPIVVAFSGTWCPNCNDEAPLLKQLYEKYHTKGLEIVSLDFEYLDDLDRSRKLVKKFRERYGTPYPVLVAGTTAAAPKSEAMAPLEGWQGYPTTLFLDRAHRIVKVHSGFDGPATGEHYTRLKKEMEATIEGLLR